MALAVPLSRFTPRVGGGSAFYVRPPMHHRILGLSSTLAFLFVGYAAAWLSDPFEISFIAGKPDALKRAFLALALSLIFTFGVLFLLVWPQTLLAGWLVRRFRIHRLFPFLLFFAISSFAVCVLVFSTCSSQQFLAYLVGTGYLLISCSILWLISFRYEPVA